MTNILSKSYICFQINRSIQKNLKQRQLIIKPNLQQQRFIQTNHQQEQSSKLVNFLYTGAKYTLIFSVTCGFGLITGLCLVSDTDDDKSNLTRPQLIIYLLSRMFYKFFKRTKKNNDSINQD